MGFTPLPARLKAVACALGLAVASLGFQQPGPARDNNHVQPRPNRAVASVEHGPATIAEFLKPVPPPRIPDDPPPHEGALFDDPYIAQPPDFLLVEVLEALPGRPITGSRMIRQDGTISLGMYGDVYVRGLTLHQIKVKVLIHLRQFINDQTLGIIDEEEPPDLKLSESELLERARRSSHMYVDVDSYNSRHYYAEGDIALPGRYPITGNETIIDALGFAGQLLPSADPNDVHLYRPARPNQPARTYKIDHESVAKGKDPSANLQLFAGDRLVIGRDPVVKTTTDLERLSSPTQLMLSQIRLYGDAMKSLQQAAAAEGVTLSPEQRIEVLKGFADLWWSSTHPDGARLDEKIFREALLRSLGPKSDGKKTDEPQSR